MLATTTSRAGTMLHPLKNGTVLQIYPNCKKTTTNNERYIDDTSYARILQSPRVHTMTSQRYVTHTGARERCLQWYETT